MVGWGWMNEWKWTSRAFLDLLPFAVFLCSSKSHHFMNRPLTGLEVWCDYWHPTMMNTHTLQATLLPFTSHTNALTPYRPYTHTRTPSATGSIFLFCWAWIVGDWGSRQYKWQDNHKRHTQSCACVNHTQAPNSSIQNRAKRGHEVLVRVFERCACVCVLPTRACECICGYFLTSKTCRYWVPRTEVDQPIFCLSEVHRVRHTYLCATDTRTHINFSQRKKV